MTEPVTLDEIKLYLRIDDDVTGEDGYLAGLIVSARRAVEMRTRRSIVGDEPGLTGDDLIAAKQAMLLLMGHWYANREGDAKEPIQVSWLLDPLTQWDDGG